MEVLESINIHSSSELALLSLCIILLLVTTGLSACLIYARRQAKRTESLLGLSHELHAIIGMEGKYHALNYEAWTRVTGYSKEELMNNPVGSFIHPDDVALTSKIAVKLRGGTACGRWENRWIAKDGSVRNFEWCCTPHVPSRRIFSVGRDVTIQKQLLADLEVKKAMAEASARAKSEFLATVSHEIRTPMNGVVGMTELLEGTTLSQEQQEYAQAIRISSRNLMSIINEILDFSHLDAKKLVLEPAPFQLDECVEGAVKEAREQCAAKGLMFRCVVDKSVPHMLVGDCARIQQVISNLVDNAVKFTREGYVSVRVSVAPPTTDCRIGVKFAVADSGVGIDEHQHGCLFQSFSQVDGSICRQFGGMGLGLAISKQLVELMNGKITAESHGLNQGSKFEFTLHFDSISWLPKDRRGSVTSDLSASRIFIIEPSRKHSAALEAMLARNGVELVNSRTTQNDAIFHLSCLPPTDLIIVGRLPGDQAQEDIRFIDEIRKVDKCYLRTPILVVRDSTQVELVSDSPIHLWQAEITRPVTWDVLHPTIIRLT